MFYKITLQRSVTVPPERLDGTLLHRLLPLLRSEVEGKPLPISDSIVSAVVGSTTAVKSSAIVLAVIGIVNDMDLQGKILDDGHVTFRITYDALVLKLHLGEVLDVEVIDVDREGWRASVFGVGVIFVSHLQMSEDPTRNPEWSYDNEGSWISRNGHRSIKAKDLVRVRVLAETPQAAVSMALGSIVGPYLGPL